MWTTSLFFKKNLNLLLEAGEAGQEGSVTN
jgi:hypothetical protein